MKCVVFRASGVGCRLWGVKLKHLEVAGAEIYRRLWVIAHLWAY